MPWIFLGIVVEAILGAVYLTTRRGAVLAAMAGALLLVVAGLVTERLVITERKRVRMDLDAAVAAIQANDLPRAERYIAASSSDLRGRLETYGSEVEFEEVRIRNVEIEINHLTSPPTASIRLWGLAKFRDRTGIMPYNHYGANFQLDLVKEPDGWKVEAVQGDPGNPLRDDE